MTTTSRILPAVYNENDYEGGTPDYNEGQLATWEGATDNDMSGSGEVLTVYKEGVAGACWDENSQVTINGASNLSATEFRCIRPAPADKHAGIPVNDGSMSGFQTTYAVAGWLILNEDHFTVHDLVFTGTINNAGDRTMLDGQSGIDDLNVVGCLGFDLTNDNGNRNFLAFGGTDCYVINCLAHNVKTIGFMYHGTDPDRGYFLNCTADGCGTAFLTWAGKLCTVKNIASENNTDNWDPNIGGTWTVTTCTDGAGVTFVGGDDFHLDSTDVQAKDQGTDVSADYNNFDDDIDGEQRTGTWDIGFDEYVAVGDLTIDVSNGISVAQTLD